MMQPSRWVRALSLLGALSVLAVHSLLAQTVTTLHSFPMLAVQPQGSLVLGNDGNFYGTTSQGGVQNVGTVFRLTPSGVTTILHSFGDPNDGANPRAALVQGSDGNFYGTTYNGGNRGNNGTVFKITPSGVETVLYSFGYSDGAGPQTLTQGSDGSFYGTTSGGGSHTRGTVFKITPSGALTVLYSFGTNPNDGVSPQGALVQDSDGNLYGTTNFGGNGNSSGTSSYGTIFKITPSGTETILFRFSDTSSDGANPAGGLVLGSDGNFYGTTSQGGARNQGTVFKVTPSGTETVLYSFQYNSPTNPSDGSNPRAALVEGADGNFYGTTYNGGGGQTNGFSYGAGTVFKITPSGTETVLYSFTGTSDGANPAAALVQGSDGNLYGTASSGGSVGGGTIFEITPAGAESVFYQFGSNQNDGAGPRAALVQGGDGNLYGTTSGGGSNGLGAVFKITAAGTETLLHSFAGSPNDGASPEAAMVQGSDGNLYGTTYSGGSQNNGTVFRITPAGAETVLYSFGTNLNDGANPQAALVQGSDGNFYGTTYSGGGSRNYGAVFQITPAGTETVLYRFGTNPNDGYYPVAALMQGSDGNFYGTTQLGGSHFSGTVFKIAPSGTETVLYSFGTNSSDGYDPEAPLMLGSDGNFYGTTSGAVSGTIFRITPSGAETVLYSLAGYPKDGAGSQAALVQSGDGNFYGTTYIGGSRDSGTVFKITPSGAETFLYSFGTNPNDGIGGGDGSMISALTPGSDGNLYGTTRWGGTGSQGVVFKVTLVSPHLAVAATHTGAFTQGAPANTLTVQVSNGGSAPTAGTVTLTDTVPVGLTLAGSNHGTINGWNVNVSGQTLTATRSDALAAGNAYPALPITVSTGDDAPASVANTANVSGGSVVFAGNNYGSDMIAIGLSTLNTWRQTYFPGSTSTTGAGADLATPKNDGITNLVKFATGLDPTTSASTPGVLSQSNGELTFIYTPSAAAVTSGFNFVVEYNDALGVNAWTSDLVNQGTLGSGGLPVTATLPAGSGGQRFVHLKVTKP